MCPPELQQKFPRQGKRLAFILAFGIWAFAVAITPSDAAPTFANAVTNGTVNIAGLTEASGVAASRNNANVLWTENDSGNPPVVYAIDTQGRLLGTYTLPGNTDNEDIGIGPGPVTNVLYLYVADIGDNSLARANVKIYQIPEPAIYARQFTNPVTATLKGARTITLTYAGGPENAESMFVDPVTGDLFILTKDSNQLFIAPRSQLDTNDSFSPALVRTVNFATPSAADISPSGNEIIVRRESFAQLWTRAPGQSIGNAFGGTPVTIPVTGEAGGEPNGEAIGFDFFGGGYFTLSEAGTQPLRYFARTSNDGPRAPREIISAGSTWKFLGDGMNQGTAWRAPSFNDSSWSNGVAQFGYGDGDEQTVVSYGTNANNKLVTTYFRKSFVLDDVSGVTNLILKLVVDDGALVYLNGALAVNYHLATNAAYNTLATSQSDTVEDAWFNFSVDPALLVNGTNVIAVEVHQAAITSSDISFDLQLLTASQANAHETFHYSPGTSLVLLTNSTGQWWSAAGTGTAPATVVPGNMNVAGLASASGAMMQFGAVDGPSARFNLISNVTGESLYFSFAARVTSLGALSTNGGYLAGFNNTRGTQTPTPTVLASRILARATNGGFNIGTSKNSTNAAEFVWSPPVFKTNEVIFFVGSYTFNASTSSDDVSKLWINPNASTFGFDPPAPALTVASGADIAGNQIASFVFLQRGLNNTNQLGAMHVDELRIGPTWASVTPPGNIPPVLRAARIGNEVVLSWPTNAPGFVLEKTSTLGGTKSWSPSPGTVSIIGDQFISTNSTSETTFYRLHK